MTHHLGLEASQELELAVKVSREEAPEAVPFVGPGLQRDAVVEALLVKVDRELVAVVHAADEILDRVALALDERLELVESRGVDELGLEPDEDAEPARVQLLEPMRLDEVGVKGCGEVCRAQVRLQGREEGRSGWTHTYERVGAQAQRTSSGYMCDSWYRGTCSDRQNVEKP